MIAAISLMRRLESVDIYRFRRHWLDVHGPLVQSFAGLRRYVQCHVIDNPATNHAARALRIDGFPFLYFDNDADRQLAHGSAAMAACNIDSRQFIGAVSRVITTPVEIVPGQGGRLSAIVFCTEGADGPAIQERLSASAGLTRFDVLQQGPAPASTVPHLTVTVSEIFQARFDSLIELEAALTDFGVPTFVVEEHCMPPT
jgi:uncharacterized protein (TIGR02118 family)